MEKTTGTLSGQFDYASAADQVIAGIRRHDIKHVEMRVALAILEFSYCKLRRAAVFPRQKHIARLTGLAKQDASNALRWLRDKFVIDLRECFYEFCLPANSWHVPFRAKQGQQLELADLEAWLAKPAGQVALIAPEPSLREALTGTVSNSLTPVSEPPTGPVSKLLTAVGKPLTGGSTYIHDRDHERFIMPHAKAGFLVQRFEVGALHQPTAAEILEEVKKAAADLLPEYEEGWLRRIQESAKTVWQGAKELQQRPDVKNRAGWLNRFYKSELCL